MEQNKSSNDKVAEEAAKVRKAQEELRRAHEAFKRAREAKETKAKQESLHKVEDEKRIKERAEEKKLQSAIKESQERHGSQGVQRRTIFVKGMHCKSCAQKIEMKLEDMNGIKSAKVSYVEQKAVVEFDDKKINIDEISKTIEKLGYLVGGKSESEKLRREEQKSQEDHDTKSKRQSKSGKYSESKDDKDEEVEIPSWIAYAFAILGIALVAYFAYPAIEGIQVPEITANMGYGLLFVVGLLTGFHCVAMCGGFVVSYTAKGAAEKVPAYKLHSLYAAGKLISYTLIGAAFGFLGSIIAFTPVMRGVAGIIAGLFLLIYGVKMLNIFPFLRGFQLTTPKFISKFVFKNSGAKESATSTPFIIGLLNGLMIACGPLQAIYIMAAGTGSPLEGAKLLFVFALGTLPVMLGFGYLTSVLSSKFVNKILKISGIILIILGLIMLNRGLSLTGSGYDYKSLTSGFTSNSAGNSGSVQANSNVQVAVEKNGYQEIRMDVISRGWSPDTFVLKKGVPVKWIINGKQLNGCNSAIQVPKYNLQFKIQQGEQTIEFTPTEEGTVSWSCWMGMIQGTFIVKNDLSNTQQLQQEATAAVAAKPVARGGGCGMMG